MECVCINLTPRVENNFPDECENVCHVKNKPKDKLLKEKKVGIGKENEISASPAGNNPIIPYPKPPASVELRSGVLISGCQCVKRDGLQHDCPRTGCQGRGACMAYPAPMCGPSGNAPPEYLEPTTEYSAEYGDKRLRPRMNRERSPRPGYYPAGADDRYIRLGRRGYRENPPVKHKEQVPCREHRKIRG